jgi:hypothetical protein
MFTISPSPRRCGIDGARPARQPSERFGRAFRLFSFWLARLRLSQAKSKFVDGSILTGQEQTHKYTYNHAACASVNTQMHAEFQRDAAARKTPTTN